LRGQVKKLPYIFSGGNMDFGKAITFVTEDERWLNKLGIGSLIMLGSVVFFPIFWLIGYQIAIIRNVIAGEERPLPEWDNWGKLFIDGLLVTIAMMVYTLPLWIILCIGMTGIFLPILGAGNEDMVAALSAVTAVVWIGVACLSVLFGIGMAFVSPAVYIQYAIKDDLKACFQFSDVFAIIRDNIVNILIVIAAALGANIVLQSAAGILAATFCGIVLAIPLGLAGTVWIMAMQAHFYGQMGAIMTGSAKSAY
jgi:hypothetical protein